ncbi:MAG TPA: arylsulfatase [Pirellulales bacterium]|nr:arylsulfatase [Pirellulales bacterium]
MRKFRVRRIAALVVAVIAGGTVSLHAPLLRAAPPNIVVVLVDDMGFSDIGCYGSEVPTPRLDRLAADGIRFTQFYNTPRCSPTRAALLTGLYSQQAGMGWLDSKVEPNSRGFHGRLLPRCVTIAEVLRDAGYFTAMTGKWHLGQQNGTPPWKRGFVRSLNSRYGEVYFPHEKDRPGTENLYLNGRELPKDSPELGENWYSTDLFVDWGLKFIDEALAAQQPFFLYIAQGAVHFPLRAPEEIIAQYRGKYLAGWDELRQRRHQRQIEMGIVDSRWPLAPRPDESPAWESCTAEERNRFDQMMAVYAAMIECIDRSMGTLVDGLAQRGVLDNTLILYLSDNGGNAEGGPNGTTDGGPPIGGPQSYVLLGMNWATMANTPFRRYKHFTHEGGISSPLVVHWPAGIAPERRGTLESQPAHLIDVMATAVDLAGAKYPTEFNSNAILPMEGVSLRPAFAGEPLGRKTPIFWEHEGNKAVRDGRWKLVQKWRGPWELYDMEADRTEQHNLIDAHSDVATRLEAAWNAWAERAFVDDWPGPDHTDWGKDIKK